MQVSPRCTYVRKNQIFQVNPDYGQPTTPYSLFLIMLIYSSRMKDWDDEPNMWSCLTWLVYQTSKNSYKWCPQVAFVSNLKQNMFFSYQVGWHTPAQVKTECIFSILWISDTEYNIFDYRKYKVIDVVIKDLRVQKVPSTECILKELFSYLFL